MSEFGKKLEREIQYAVAVAIERHKRLGQTIVVRMDGEIRELTGDEIPPFPAHFKNPFVPDVKKDGG